MVQTIYPENKWDMYKFSSVPRGYKKQLLENTTEQKEFVKYLEKRFNITQTNDWYGITNKQLSQVMTIDVQTALKIIKNYYPDINLDKIINK